MLYKRIKIRVDSIEIVLDSINSIQNNIRKGGVLALGEEKFLNYTFGFTSFDSLSSFFAKLSNNWKQLEYKYSISSLSNEDLEKASTIMLDKLGLKILVDNEANNGDVGAIPDGCKARYNNCAAGVLAQCLIAATGCAALVLPVLVIPCEAGVILYEITELNKCRYDYNDCMGRKVGPRPYIDLYSGLSYNGLENGK